MAVAVQRTIPSDLVVSAIRIKVAFISSIETHMFSNIFPDLSLFRDLKYPTYNQLLRFWWRLFKLLSSYHNQTLVFLRCHKNLLCKFWRLPLLEKGFSSLFNKGPIQRKGHKNGEQWWSTEEVFYKCRLSFQKKENLISRKKVVVDHFNYFLHIRTACLSLDQTVSYYFPGIKVNWVLQRNLDDRYLSYK